MNDDAYEWSLEDAVDHTLMLVSGFRALRAHSWDTVFAYALREHFDTVIGWKKYGTNIHTARGRAGLPHSLQARNNPEVPKHREHVVPMKVLVKHAMLAETTNEMRLIVDAYSLSIVTADEHALLSKAYPNARDTMPDGWELGDDPFYRYRAAAIEMELLD